MARSIQLTLHESQQELEHHLGSHKRATDKERLQMLYWLKRGIAKNRPCELFSEGRVATFPKENYAQRVYHIPSCFDQKGIFNLNLPSCGLEKP